MPDLAKAWRRRRTRCELTRLLTAVVLLLALLSLWLTWLLNDSYGCKQRAEWSPCWISGRSKSQKTPNVIPKAIVDDCLHEKYDVLTFTPQDSSHRLESVRGQNAYAGTTESDYVYAAEHHGIPADELESSNEKDDPSQPSTRDAVGSDKCPAAPELSTDGNENSRITQTMPILLVAPKYQKESTWLEATASVNAVGHTPVNKTLFLNPIPLTIVEYLTKHRIKLLKVDVERGRSESAVKLIADHLRRGNVLSVVVDNYVEVCLLLGENCASMATSLRNSEIGVVFSTGSSPIPLTNIRFAVPWIRGDHLSITNGPGALQAISPAPNSPVHHILKRDGGKWSSPKLSVAKFLGMSCHTSNCKPLLHAFTVEDDDVPVAISLSMKGRRQVVIGTNVMALWITRLALLDSIQYVSKGLINLPLSRKVQVDIDDVFLGAIGNKPTADNIQELINSQNRLCRQIPGFQYYLGYVGGAYRTSTVEEENAADKLLVDYASHFAWFPHTYNHTKTHLLNTTQLLMAMRQSKAFAKMHGISVRSQYAVTPHHSGVYPVHQPLYDAWRAVWNITVSSTEEYLHLKPAYRRRGFYHSGVWVLPRQTCGLFSHTLTQAAFPGGSERLTFMAEGGELFQTLVDNPISIFMTHYVNFGGEMLAIKLLENLVQFTQSHTNLVLSSQTPGILAKEYFDSRHEEKEPIWQDPCGEVRLYNRWFTPGKICFTLPSVLLTGDGTVSAKLLANLLLAHPDIFGPKSIPDISNMQFLSSDQYLKGVDWYMEKFPNVRKPVAVTNNMSSPYTSPPHIIDFSPAYFSSQKAPLRAWRLLPHAIVIIVLDDAHRKLQSCKVPGIKLNSPRGETREGNNGRRNSPSLAEAIKHHLCSPAGSSFEYLQQWLKFFEPSKMYLVDSKALWQKPALTTSRIQEWLGVKQFKATTQIRTANGVSSLCIKTSKEDTNGDTCLPMPSVARHSPHDTRALPKLVIEDKRKKRRASKPRRQLRR